MKIIINENQEKLLHKYLLKEAMMEQFSYDDLNSIKTFKGKLEYCKKYLGEPIGKGSSRIVFQIDDEKVLKLATNRKGLAQNETEDSRYYKAFDWVLPRVYETADDFSFIVSEYVLPATKGDFKKVLGLTFEEFVEFVNTAYNQYSSLKNQIPYSWCLSREKFINILDNNEEIQEIYGYLTNTTYDCVCDLRRITNWGLTNRDGYPCLVILDNGLSEEIYKKLYKKWTTL